MNFPKRTSGWTTCMPRGGHRHAPCAGGAARNDQVHAKAELERRNNRMDVVSDMTLAEESTFTAQADIGFADLSFLEPFLGDLLFDLAGGLNGRIDVETRAGTLRADGDLAFDRTRFRAGGAGAVYQIPDGRLHLDGRNVELDGRVLDSLDQAMVLDGFFSRRPLRPHHGPAHPHGPFRAVQHRQGERRVLRGPVRPTGPHRQGPWPSRPERMRWACCPARGSAWCCPAVRWKLVESEGRRGVHAGTLRGGHHRDRRSRRVGARLADGPAAGCGPGREGDRDPEARFFIVLDPHRG